MASRSTPQTEARRDGRSRRALCVSQQMTIGQLMNTIWARTAASDTADPLTTPQQQVTDRSLVEALRVIWWGQAALGNRMPPEPDVILIEGGRQ